MLSLITIVLTAQPTLSKPLNLKTVVSINSSVKEGQLIYENNLVIIREHGFYKSLLNPIKSIRVESTGCTRMIPTILRQVDDGIILKVTAKGILGCSYSPFVRIISTTKSPRTKVSSSFLDRELLLSSVSTINAYENINGEAILGSSVGSAEVNYQKSSAVIVANYFVKSKTNSPISTLALSPEPYLNSTGTLPGNLHRVCTDANNVIVSKLNYKSRLLKESNCLDTKISDSFLVQSPKGYRYYRFDS